MRVAFPKFPKLLTQLSERGNKLCHFMTTSEGYKPIDPPKLAQDLVCPFCGTAEYFLWKLEDDKRAWTCGLVCKPSKLPKLVDPSLGIPKPNRAILWPLFCEINGIGDCYHDVVFENVNQSAAMKDYMLRFATKPKSILLMRGAPGTGKTYAALAICEYYTRTQNSCVFTTQKRMATDWLECVKAEKLNYIDIINTTSLLVVDDFATGEPGPGFMSFFMDMINTRMQWTNRGTIITTNLCDNKFNSFCGEALTDRILTGQEFQFKGQSKRRKIIV